MSAYHRAQMTGQTTGRPTRARTAAALAIGAMALVACGPSASPPASSGPTEVSTPLATPSAAPTATAAAAASFPVPSFIGDKELEAMFPEDVGGVPLTVVSILGSELPAAGGIEQVMAVLKALHKQPSDLSVAFSGTPSVTIQAFRVKGVPASQILPALVTVYQQGTPSTTAQVTVAGKRVTRFTPVSGTDPAVYVYATGDTVFTVGGQQATTAVLEEVFAKLP